ELRLDDGSLLLASRLEEGLEVERRDAERHGAGHPSPESLLRYPRTMELPLEEERIRSIVAHLAHLRAAYGEAFAAPDLVQPNGEYFPDEFTLSPEGIQTLLRRMLGYAPVSDDLE